MLSVVVEKYKKWKVDNPDESFQYDEIFEFTAGLWRGELQAIFDFLEEKLTSSNKSLPPASKGQR